MIDDEEKNHIQKRGPRNDEKPRRVGSPADEEEGGVSHELGEEAEIDESSSDVTDTED